MLRRYLAAFGSSVMLHLLVVLMMVWTPAGLLIGNTPASGGITVEMMPPPEQRGYPGLNPIDSAPPEWALPDAAESSMRIGALRIDVAKIGERAAVLFPFLTPGLSLEAFLRRSRPASQPPLHNPLAAPASADQVQGGPLRLTDAELQSLVDGAWARRDRWRAFEPLSRLADAHDADAGALPRLLQRYVDQDSLQPYADQSSRDPRLWAQLGLAADHVDFIRFIRRYAAAHPSTRATTELLFLLDRLAEASRDALSVLLGSDPSEQLRWTRASYPQAYRLLTQIRAYVENALVRLDLRTEDAVTAHYERTRLGILEAIVRTTPEGYRASDARFLIGEVYWRQQRVDEALRCWSAMVVASGDSRAVPAGNLLRALRTYPPARSKTGDALVSAPLRREIDQILKNEHGRWVMFSYDRLRQFGFRFDTY